MSGRLYMDGHYKQAALEAYIRVIDEVKRLSGLPLDGDRLMNALWVVPAKRQSSNSMTSCRIRTLMSKPA